MTAPSTPNSLSPGSRRGIFFRANPCNVTKVRSAIGTNTNCTQRIGEKITFRGNSGLAINCAGDGVKLIGVSGVSLSRSGAQRPALTASRFVAVDGRPAGLRLPHRRVWRRRQGPR